MNIKLLYITILTFLNCNFAFAKADIDAIYFAVTPQDSIQIQQDKTQRKPLELDRKTLEKFAANPAFDYTQSPPEDNWYTRIKRKIAELYHRFIDWLLSGEKAEGVWAVIVKSLPYVLLMAFIGLLLWLILRLDNGTLMLSSAQKSSISFSDDEQIIKNENIEVLIQKAIQQENYRLATRYYFLLTLKKLSLKELISWQTEKTNSDYLNELKDTPNEIDFKNLVRIYNHIWYGNFSIDKVTFTTVESNFQTLIQSL